VETVKADPESSKLTVVGNVDPTSLRDKLAEKAKKKVELLSPQPKKDNKADDKSDQKPEKKSDEKKPKEVIHWSPLTVRPFLFNIINHLTLRLLRCFWWCCILTINTLRNLAFFTLSFKLIGVSVPDVCFLAITWGRFFLFLFLFSCDSTFFRLFFVAVF
jgi:hypothetical protein